MASAGVTTVVTASGNGEFVCHVCDTKLPNETVYQQHLAGKKHQKKVVRASARSVPMCTHSRAYPNT